MMGQVAARGGDHQEIHPGGQFHDARRVLIRQIVSRMPIVIVDRHIESRRALGNLRADIAEPHYTQRATADPAGDAHPAFGQPAPVADIAVAGDDPATDRQDQAEGMLGDIDGIYRAGVGDRNPTRGRRGRIDALVANTHIDDDLDRGQGIQHGPIQKGRAAIGDDTANPGAYLSQECRPVVMLPKAMDVELALEPLLDRPHRPHHQNIHRHPYLHQRRPKDVAFR